MARHPDMTTLGRNIRALRHANNWSRERLADLIADITGTEPDTANTLGQIERGSRQTMKIERLHAYATAFGVTVDRLISAGECGICTGRPPRYFTCRVCGKEG
jgi:transcriptional regulator with XRE-family HTH domain